MLFGKAFERRTKTIEKQRVDHFNILKKSRTN